MAVDVATIVHRLLPGAIYGSANGRDANEQYAQLERTWRDPRPIPTRAAIEAARSATDTDQIAIDADPSLDEIVEVLLAAAPNTPPITALRNRRTAADTARGRSGQPRGRFAIQGR